jgi:hypothetical protein
MVSYDDRGCVNFIEVPLPAAPALGDVQLAGRPAALVIEDLAKLGISAIHDQEAETVWIPDYGARLFAPDGVVEGVSIGSGDA